MRVLRGIIPKDVIDDKRVNEFSQVNEDIFWEN
jgi:hypothetical protein